VATVVGAKKISLGSWAFSFGPYARKPVAFNAVVKRLAEAGYDGIEVCGFPPHVSLDRYSTASSRREVATFIADNGLGVSGYDADFSMVNPIVAGNSDRYLELFQRNLEMAAALGSPSIRVDTVAAPGSIAAPAYENAFHLVAEVWRECADLAAKAKLRLVWEFEPGFVFNKPHEVVKMHQEVRHPNFFILFDTAHAYMCGVVGARQNTAERDVVAGGLNDFLDMLQGRIGAIHLIDSDGTLDHDETSTHRPFGEGLIDFPKLVPKLVAVPGIEWWTVDLCFWPEAWEQIGPSRMFVANLLEARK